MTPTRHRLPVAWALAFACTMSAACNDPGLASDEVETLTAVADDVGEEPGRDWDKVCRDYEEAATLSETVIGTLGEDALTGCTSTALCIPYVVGLLSAIATYLKQLAWLIGNCGYNFCSSAQAESNRLLALEQSLNARYEILCIPTAGPNCETLRGLLDQLAAKRLEIDAACE